MTWKYKFILRPIFLLGDLLTIFMAFWIATFFRYGSWELHHVQNLIASMVIWVILTPLFRLNHVPRNYSISESIRTFLVAQTIFIGFVSLNIIFANQDHLSRLFYAYFLTTQFLLLVFLRYMRRHYMGFLRSQGRNRKAIYLLGSEVDHQRLSEWLENSPYSGYVVRNQYFHAGHYEKNCEECLAWVEHSLIKNSGDDFVINPKHCCETESLDQVIHLAEDLGACVHLIHPLQETNDDLLSSKRIGPFTVIPVREEPLLRPWATVFKRGFDVGFSGLVTVLVLSWFIPLIALLIKLTSRGPVFFIQERIGKGRKSFNCLKLRTMRTDHRPDNGNEQITHEDDDRITRIGKFLRRTNLDEVPQFLNVLIGDMSVVGPRPHMVSEDFEMERLIPRYRLRQRVRPGITGWAAVNGYRGGTSRLELMQKRIEYDIWYIENWTASLEMKIVCKTFWQMLTFRTGAH